MKNGLIMLLIAGGVWALSTPATPVRAGSARPQALMSFEFVDERGHVLDTYPADSRRADVYRAFLEAMPQARYSIRVRNHTGERLGVVIAVDGRNIISGGRSDLAATEAMYILGPYETATYSGWRTSPTEVRRFYFTSVDDSYASRIGDETAIGVIAAAAFTERRERHAMREDREEAPAAPEAATEAQDASAARAGRAAQAGTGFGEREHSRAVRVTFTPVHRAGQRSFFKYEWPEQLCARGVKRCGPPNRFWPEWNGFVPLPPDELG